jgi:hypothetical protein
VLDLESATPARGTGSRQLPDVEAAPSGLPSTPVATGSDS